MRNIVSLISIFICLSLCAAGDELVDSKVYQSWTRFKLGTSTESKSTISAPNGPGGAMQQLTVTAVSTLTDITTESVTTSTQIVDASNGRTAAQPEITRHMAKVRQGLEYAPAGFRGTMNQVGNEPITVGDKTFDCRIMEFEGFSEANLPMKGKVWISDLVPGAHVKVSLELTAEGKQVTVNMQMTRINPR